MNSKSLINIRKIFSFFTALIMIFSVLTVVKPIKAEAGTDDEFENSIAAFPESYKVSLRKLHEEHPAWKFECVDIPLDWNEVLNNECVTSRKLVPKTGHSMSLGVSENINGVNTSWYPTPTVWKSLYRNVNGKVEIDFDMANDSWSEFDTKEWNQASESAIAYVMDPRNWLNDTHIFMFEQLSFNDAVTYNDVNLALAGTFMGGKTAYCLGSPKKTYPNGWTYYQTIRYAAKQSGVSAMHLAIRLRQEKGVNNDILGSGVAEKADGTFRAAVKGDTNVYYNFFNIGACGNGYKTVINNGGREAKNEGWTSPFLAILGGAQKVRSFYIDIGQDTVYFQMFSVVNPDYYYWKQYAQNLCAPLTEGAAAANTYRKAGLIDLPIVFRIPVYRNMPAKASSRPATDSGDFYSTANPNYALKSLSVTYGNGTEKNYNLDFNPVGNWNCAENEIIYLPYETETVTINASAVNANAKVTGTGLKNLEVGMNKYTVTCTSQLGGSYKRKYNISIFRADGSTSLTSLKPSVGRFTHDYDKDTTAYALFLENNVDKVSFKYIAESSKARVYTKINDKLVACSNGEIPSHSLSEGKNTVRIYVVNEGYGKTNKTQIYTVSVYRYSKVDLDSVNLQINNGWINGFMIGETVGTAKQIHKINGGYLSIFDINGVEKKDDDVIITGDIIKVFDANGYYYRKYNAVIYGDVWPDGIVDTKDLIYMKRPQSLSKIQTEAANLNHSSDGLNDSDLAIIKNYLYGNGTISQFK